MAFLSGCPLFLPVHTVNCVQTLKAVTRAAEESSRQALADAKARTAALEAIAAEQQQALKEEQAAAAMKVMEVAESERTRLIADAVRCLRLWPTCSARGYTSLVRCLSQRRQH
jgi:hypothetical protein